MPIKTIQGKVEVDESIFINDENIGKILINNDYPFGLIKIKEKNLDFSKKYKCEIVPIYIERLDGTKFKIIINKPMKFKNEDSIKKITTDLNLWLESMILKNPSQWIWTHNRWK